MRKCVIKIGLCKKHGRSDYAQRADGRWRCKKCAVESVVRRRKRSKRILVEEFGGKCVICGYSISVRSLTFHHVDPTTKEFNVSTKYNRSIHRLRNEAKKCILVCQNCHGEVEEGMHDIFIEKCKVNLKVAGIAQW